MFWVCQVLSKSLYWKQFQLKILYKLFSLNTSNTQKRFCRTESLSAGFTRLPLLHWSNCLIGPLCKIWVSLGRNCEQALLLKWKWHMGEDPQNNADNPEKQKCFLVQCILIIIFTHGLWLVTNSLLSPPQTSIVCHKTYEAKIKKNKNFPYPRILFFNVQIHHSHVER